LKFSKTLQLNISYLQVDNGKNQLIYHEKTVILAEFSCFEVLELQLGLKEVNESLIAIEKKAKEAADKHNEFLKELGLPLI